MDHHHHENFQAFLAWNRTLASSTARGSSRRSDPFTQLSAHTGSINPCSYREDSFLPGSFRTQLGNSAEDVPPPWAKKSRRRKNRGRNEYGQGPQRSSTYGSFQSNENDLQGLANDNADLDQYDTLHSSDVEAAAGRGGSLYNRIRQNRRRMKPRDERIYHNEDDREISPNDYMPGPRTEKNAPQSSDDEGDQESFQSNPATRNASRREQGDFDGGEPPVFPDDYESPAEESGNKAQRAPEADDDRSDATFDIRPCPTRKHREEFQAHMEQGHDLYGNPDPQNHWGGTPPDTRNDGDSYFDDQESVYERYRFGHLDEGERGAPFRNGGDFSWASDHLSPSEDYQAAQFPWRIHKNSPRPPRESDVSRLRPLKGCKHR